VQCSVAIDQSARHSRRAQSERANFMKTNSAVSSHTDTADVIRRFNDVFQRHDPSALRALVAHDCVIENTQPAPDGSRHVGRDACVELWTGIATAAGTRFDLEDVVVAEDRAIIRWRYHWGEGADESTRGVNLMRVRDGLIIEAMGYVKGN
jgi:ketosteroid isomerase-like protein